MKTQSRRKRNTGIIVFSILFVILSLVLIGQGIHIFDELTYDRTRTYMDESEYISRVTYEHYYQLYRDTAYDCALDRQYTPTENEIRALGYYYEAASLYKAYTAVGDTASADRQHARMDRYKSAAGAYGSEIPAIHERLGLT